ncbi:MAG TPA: CBS domain-containing protein [Desulfobacterales bacterium]|nr:CBS domain-containing protein [Desulfobacterales bacterium]
MYIKRYMTVNPCAAGPTTTIAGASELLSENNCRHLPIVDEETRLLGMVTDRDLRSACPSILTAPQALTPEQLEVAGQPVSRIMSRDIVTLNPLSTLDDALLLLDRKKVGALPVLTDDGRLAGIFSTRDLLQAYRRLFGLGERGSALISVRDDGRPRPLSRLVRVLEEHDIHFSRISRRGGEQGGSGAESGGGAVIYVRVNTFNLHAVRQALEQAGFIMLDQGD